MKKIVALTALCVCDAVSAQVEPPYDVVLAERDFMMPMRDGVRLATDIYRPTDGGEVVTEPLPVLLQRTPYHKNEVNLCRTRLSHSVPFLPDN